jgi:hypothetical protein
MRRPASARPGSCHGGMGVGFVSARTQKGGETALHNTHGNANMQRSLTDPFCGRGQKGRPKRPPGATAARADGQRERGGLRWGEPLAVDTSTN